MKGTDEPITETERQKFRRIVADAREAIREKNEEIDALGQDLARAQDEIDEKTTAFAEMQKHIDRLRESLEASQIEIGRLKGRAKLAEMERENAQSAVAAMRSALGGANVRILAMEGVINDLRREIASLKSKGPAGGFESLFGSPRAIKSTIAGALPDGVTLTDLLKVVHPDRFEANPELKAIATRLTTVVLQERKAAR